MQRCNDQKGSYLELLLVCIKSEYTLHQTDLVLLRYLKISGCYKKKKENIEENQDSTFQSGTRPAELPPSLLVNFLFRPSTSARRNIVHTKMKQERKLQEEYRKVLIAEWLLHTIFSRLQATTRKFAECVPNLQEKYVRMVVFLYLKG